MIVCVLVFAPLLIRQEVPMEAYSGTGKYGHAGTVSAEGFQGHIDDCAQAEPE